MSTAVMMIAFTGLTVCPRLTVAALAYAGEMGVRTLTWGVNRVVFGPAPTPMTAQAIRSILREELTR